MSRRLPSLNALRAFEAAARHLSFTRAAGELHVTQAAISHQVKALEDWLGFRLFHRLSRELRLTEEGQAYLPALSDAFDGIERATARLKREDEPRFLTVSTMVSFAAGWLVPRLKRFRAAHPAVDVRLTTSDEFVDFDRDGVDIAIRYGRGGWPGLRVERLMEEDFFPVCSPGLRDGPAPLAEPADLRHHTLLHDDLTITWATWLDAAGVPGLAGVKAERGPFFINSHLAFQAAIAGEGVAIGRSALVAGDIAAGRLVRPFDISLPADFAYYVVCPEASAVRPKVAAFRDWLFAEAAG